MRQHFLEAIRRGGTLSRLAVFVLALGLAAGNPSAARADGEEGVRACWVVRTTMTNPRRIERMVRRAKQNGVKVLFVQVRGRADAYYRSHVEPRAEAVEDTTFDPLALAIKLGHEQGLEVHAWLNVFLVWSADKNPRDPGHIVNAHSDWLAVLPDGHSVFGLTRYEFDQAVTEGMYTAAGNPEVRAEFLSVVRDLLQNYAVDGVHLDYVRYPSSPTGYDYATRTEFMRLTGVDPAWMADRPEYLKERYGAAGVDDLAKRWAVWQTSNVTALVRGVRALADSIRLGTQVTAAVISDLDAARGRNRQDWIGWLKDGLLDYAVPMTYSPDDGIYRHQLSRILAEAPGKKVVAGVGVYDETAHGANRKMRIARELGAAGISLFSYDAIEEEPAYWQAIRREFMGLP